MYLIQIFKLEGKGNGETGKGYINKWLHINRNKCTAVYYYNIPLTIQSSKRGLQEVINIEIII